MVGYKNDEYRHFGWATAKLDDIVNFIPARLTGILIVAGAFLTGKEYKNSYSIMMRDRKNMQARIQAIPRPLWRERWE